MMKRRIAAMVFGGFLGLAATAQEVGPSLVTPSTASVSAETAHQLLPGQAFDFLLHFDPPPDGYGGGKITFRFQRVIPPTPPGRARYQDLDLADVSGAAELHDGQAIYTLSLPISDEMSRGTWKLVEVSLGKDFMRPVPISEDIKFQIPEIPPVVLHTQTPGKTRAGRRFTFKVTIDEYPRNLAEGCVPTLGGVLRPAVEPGNIRAGADEVELQRDRHSYELSGLIDADVPDGPWIGIVSLRAKPSDPAHRGFCRSPQNLGDMRFYFDVEPAIGLVTPTSVAVTVNPSQIQLLLAAADRLKAKAEHLNQQLNSENMAANQSLLRNNVQEAVADLDKTEKSYKQEGLDQSSSRAVNIFFDDIRINYGEALKTLANESAKAPLTRPGLEHVSAAIGGPSPRLNLPSKAVLASILHNAKAYSLVASSGLITFNLDVNSDPKGASVSYRQRGGEYHTWDRETDSTIENLPRAVYLIRLQKQGYEDQEVTFDAMESTKGDIHVQLVRKHGAR
jgi:hypothetical protein